MQLTSFEKESILMMKPNFTDKTKIGEIWFVIMTLFDCKIP
jgi:hypothetical protein